MGSDRPLEQVFFLAKTVQKAGLDPKEVTAYSLRHSSIVRQLLGHVPLRVCAAHHDTSAVISYRRHRFPPVIIQHAVWLALSG